LEARFRLVVPVASEPIHSTLVFLPGTDGDGRSVVDNPAFREMARVSHAAVLGCYYRGEGLSYDDPSGGSGRALDKALVSLSAQAGQPQLANFPLLLVGFSQGSMFAFNYVCWRPDRVKAFAALRAIFPRMEPQEESFQVPGLLAAGENDEPGRVRSIANAFLKAKGHDAKWALLFERNSGHDVGRSLELAKLIFEAVCQNSATPAPILFDAGGTEVRDAASNTEPLCYFPSQNGADLWKELHRPISLENLVSLPDGPRLRDLISVENPEAPFQCENGKSRNGTIRISTRTPGVVIREIRMTGEGFNIRKASLGSLPTEIQICFTPRNMPWGRAKAILTLSGCRNGVDVGAVVTTLSALVQGAVTPVPSLVYLGVVPLGRDTEEKVLLKTILPGAHLTDLKLPEEITASVERPDTEGNLPLRIHWSPRKRLGRMEGQIDLVFDAPQKGILRIPVVGFVAPERGGTGAESLPSRADLLWAGGNSGSTLFEMKGEL
jgi:predicted esterase